ncbi:MAG TPA: replicative DNA helicase [Polyangiaceae bacterium]|nr:replicative DNA helicase [Polyangiaceae bacterium]
MAEKLLPRCDLDAEAAVLSAALLSQDAALEVAEILRADDFFGDANRHVFNAIVAVLAENGACDIVAVQARLRATGRLEQVGGSPYLAQLADATPAIANVAEHARVVRNLARVRRAGAVFALLAAEAKAAPIEDFDAWLESCEARACAATAERGDGPATASDYRELAADAYEQFSAASKAGKPMLGRAMGFHNVDQHLGGVEPGDLVVIAGRPGMGKTAYALQVAETISSDARDKGLAVIFSLEMNRKRLIVRSISRVVGVAANSLRAGKVADWSAVSAGVATLGTLPVVVDDDPSLTPMRLRAKLRRHVAGLRRSFPGYPLACVVVDYIQLMNVDNARKQSTRAEEISQITRSLKQIAKEFNCTVFALSQFRRLDPGKAAPRPQLHDLRESGSIEQDADVVLALHREDYYRPPEKQTHDGRTEVLVLKGRNSGEAVHLIKFHGRTTSFSDDFEPRKQLDLINGANGNGQHYDDSEQYEARYP